MTSLRCKVGDLAIVTKCSVHERLGLIVKVVEGNAQLGHDWLTEFQGDGVPGNDVTTGRLQKCRYALMHDWNLTPIRPGEMLDDIETHEVDHA
ncbi:hypothetical protein [Burkholderia glumae]|uniref:hypothetical protein n=1 Tax=Burkholderia glumae TaxID=337 RepID=UPI0021509C56|nr:hypothetical protein [Burkholderia glumae]UVS93463.1 hypothetical protein EFP17_28180 [Burkholderia glumae]